MHYLIMAAPILMQVAVYMKKNLGQKLTKNSPKKTSKIWSQPILKMRTVQLPISFTFNVIAKKIAHWEALNCTF